MGMSVMHGALHHGTARTRRPGPVQFQMFHAAGKEAAVKYSHLARLCGLAPNPRALAAGWNRLRAQLKLPDRLTACGVETRQLHAALDELTAAALGDLCAPTNPRSAPAEDVKALLKELA